jgi:hypothetical protein
MKVACVVLAMGLFVTMPAIAGPADVIRVEVTQEDGERWRFEVTVQHADRDPDHWADWWRVRTPEGQEFGRRVLPHSHVGEQPFTRDEVVHTHQASGWSWSKRTTRFTASAGERSRWTCPRPGGRTTRSGVDSLTIGTS